LLLIVAYILLSTAEYLLSRRETTVPLLLIARQIISILFLLSLTMVVFHHAAGFRGDMFIVRPSKPTSLEDLLEDVQMGSRTLLVEVKDILPPKVEEKLKEKRVGVEFIPKNQRALERLCDDHSTAAILNTNNILELGEVRPDCELVRYLYFLYYYAIMFSIRRVQRIFHKI
ncbi:hypothetical protein PMAYCL1PPCAC_03754, partial [Pristionchus mayeri]